jgi:hypothetical protein
MKLNEMSLENLLALKTEQETIIRKFDVKQHAVKIQMNSLKF